MAEPLVTLEEFADFIDSDTASGVADMAIRAASDVVRNYTGRMLSFESDVVVKLDGGVAGLLLPGPPIRTLTEVIENDVTLDPATDYVVLMSAGILYRTAHVGHRGTWCWGFQNIQVTYDRGYDLEPTSYPGGDLMPLPDVIRLTTMSVAKRLLAVGTLPVGGFRSETMGDYSYTMADTPPPAFSLAEDEKVALGPYKDRHVL